MHANGTDLARMADAPNRSADIGAATAAESGAA